MLTLKLLGGRRGEALIDGRIVARVGAWEARTRSDDIEGAPVDWDGECDCEWYRSNNEEAFERFVAGGVEVDLKLFDHNNAVHTSRALVHIVGKPLYMGDVVSGEMSIKGVNGIE